MLIDCTLYGNRTRWFREITDNCPNFSTLNSHQKFVYLMSQGNEQLTNEIAKKIAEWQELRALIFDNFLDPSGAAPEHIAFEP